ncbi:hypothetical protein SGRIM128S_01976 [Streptomyces griseomycini]
MQRRQRIYDALRLLTPYFDHDLYLRAYQAALDAHDESTARGHRPRRRGPRRDRRPPWGSPARRR